MRDSDTAVASLAFGVLGPLEATYAGKRVPLGGRQQRVVLALLVCELGRVVSIERLMHEVWRTAPPPGAVTSLQTYVFRLRRLLEPTRAHGTPGRVLVTVPGGYRLDIDPSWVDMTGFEQDVAAGDLAMHLGALNPAVTAYGSALARWRGDVLADLADLDFVLPLRARLDEMRTSAQQSRVQARLELGDHLDVLGELEALVAEHPLREALHAQRMLALYRSGRQSDALAAYRELRALLGTELGIDPSPPLQELNSRILSQDPTLACRGPRAGLPATSGSATTPAQTPAASAERAHAPAPRPGGRTRSRRRRLGGIVAGIATVALLAVGATMAGRDDPAGPRSQRGVPANAASQVDGSGSIVTSVAVGANPIALALARDRVWVVSAGEDTVSEIDPSTSAIQQVTSVGHDPRAVAVTGDDLWVTNFADGTVSRIDGPTGRVVDTIDVGSGPDAIAAGPAGLWVANSGDNTIQRINPVSGVPAVPIPVGDGPDGLAVDGTSVWVANGRSGSVMRIDGRTGQQMTPPVQVGTGPRGLARAGPDVWVADELSQSVTRIDVATGHTDTISVPDGPTAVAALGDSIWVAAKYSGALVRIDPDTGRSHIIDAGAPVAALTVVGDHLWVASGAFPSSGHRGGTLRIAAALLPGDIAGIDPAGIYERTTLHAVRGVYDGLLAYNYSTADPQVLVPDLATTVPEPTDGGRTYTFNLRRGIRYSTGAEVKASDLVRGVHRALLSRSGRPDFYAGVVGAQACIEHPTRPASCDLGRGVVADDDDGRVTFHLTAPDPLFPYKLTLLVVPTPAGTPLRDLGSALPGTGPYRVTGYRPHRTFDLDRNPYFRQWSAPAQPDGFPDRITWTHVTDVRAAVAAVRQGDADLAELTPLGETGREAGSIVDRLSVSLPSRLHSSIVQGIYFAVLNSSVAPFDDVRVRRAINYAVDREEVVDLLGGPAVAATTCQLLPPSMPGYARYCPFTTDAALNGYRGPVPDRAARLVTESGTRGMEVAVTDIVDDPEPPLSAYLAGVLRDLGYRARIRHLPNTQHSVDTYYGNDSGIQVEAGGWFADFPAPSNFLDLVGCGATGGYPFNYCNRGLDRRTAAADAAFRTDPTTALATWADVDRAVTDHAALVPLANPVNWWLNARRVGNYQNDSRDIGPLLSQLWVR
ncbi:ABC transporter substrate-binding protein [Nocardioides sp. URHA0032]|uniref:ABC transporter substrate-binding protein n=1 Tax=Nocardioides sp. URHA0032 TaxID=1380388 RepID=UPI000490C0E8|nr:ABC transporter substrate-binding protein [Nocardioides sp. URHA0032]